MAKSLFFLGQDVLSLSVDAACEDAGIAAIRRFDSQESSLLLMLSVVPIAVAAGSIDYLLALVWRRLPERRLVGVVSPLVIALWVFFTFASLVSLVQFGRAPISFALKFTHVGFELLNLFNFLLLAGYTGSGMLTLLLAVFGLYASITLPCDVAYALTSIGAVLDSINFFFAAFLLRRHFSPALLWTTVAFLLHASYIWAFLWMSYMVAADDASAILALRVYGVWANAFSIHFGTLAVDMFDRARADAPVVEARTEATARDACAFDGPRDTPAYTLLDEGVALPRRASTGLVLLAQVLGPRAVHVRRDGKGATLRALGITLARLDSCTWRAHVVVDRNAVRRCTVGGWVAFVLLLSSFLWLDVHVATAAVVAWVAPASLSALLVLGAARLG